MSLTRSYMDYDYLFKLLMIGDGGVGKTSLMLRFTENTFLGPSQSFTTIGVDFKIKNVQVGGKKIRLQVWDTAGQERFRTIINSYYRGAHGVILVYDTTDVSSFESLKQWLQDINRFAALNVRILLVGTKCDLVEQRAVTFEEGRDFADAYGMQFIEASAKSNVNVENLFLAMTWELMQHRKDLEAPKQAEKIEIKALASKKTTCC